MTADMTVSPRCVFLVQGHGARVACPKAMAWPSEYTERTNPQWTVPGCPLCSLGCRAVPCSMVSLKSFQSSASPLTPSLTPRTPDEISCPPAPSYVPCIKGVFRFTISNPQGVSSVEADSLKEGITGVGLWRKLLTFSAGVWKEIGRSAHVHSGTCTTSCFLHL